MANRFDELLPIQPILHQSLYTPFRMKDNTDLYTKLISVLATKKDKTIKPDAVPIAERHKPILPIQYKTNNIVLPDADISQGTNMTFNIDYSTPYNYIENILWNSINAQGDQLVNTLVNGSIDDDNAMALVLGYKRNLAGYKNNQTLEKYRIMTENIFNMTKGLQNNAELDTPTYKKLAIMEFLSKNMLDAPLESKVESKDITFNQALKQYYTAIKDRGVTEESAIRPIWEAVSDKSLVQIFETITRTSKGSYYNPEVENLREFNDLKSAANNLLELQLMTNLKNRSVTREYQNGQLKYDNLYDLHLLIEDSKLFTNTNFQTLRELGKEELVNSMLKDRELILSKNVEIQENIKDDLNNFKIDNDVFKGTYGQLEKEYNKLREDYPKLIEEYNTLKKSNNPDLKRIKEIEGKFETLEKYSKQLIKSEYEFIKKKFEDIREMKGSLDKDLYYYNLVKKVSIMESIKNIEKNLNISKGAFTSKEDAATRNNQTVGLTFSNPNNNNNNGIKDSEKGFFATYEPMSVNVTDGVGTFVNTLAISGSLNKLQGGSNPIQTLFATNTDYKAFIEGGDEKNIVLYNNVSIDKTGKPVLIVTAKNISNDKTTKKEIYYDIDSKGEVIYVDQDGINRGQFQAWKDIIYNINPETKQLAKEFEGKMIGVAKLAKNQSFNNKSNKIEANSVEQKIGKTIFDEENYKDFSSNININMKIANDSGNSVEINKNYINQKDLANKLNTVLNNQMTTPLNITYEIKDKNNKTIMTISSKISKDQLKHNVDTNSFWGSIKATLYNIIDAVTGGKEDINKYLENIFSREQIYMIINGDSTISVNYDNADKFFSNK